MDAFQHVLKTELILIVMHPHINPLEIESPSTTGSGLTKFGQIVAKNVLHLLAMIDLTYILTIAFKMLLG